MSFPHLGQTTVSFTGLDMLITPRSDFCIDHAAPASVGTHEGKTLYDHAGLSQPYARHIAGRFPN